MNMSAAQTTGRDLPMRMASGVFVTLGGLLLAATPEAAAAAQEPAEPRQFRAVAELTVGDALGPVTLTRVGHIVLDGEHVYVSQPADRRILVLSGNTGDVLDAVQVRRVVRFLAVYLCFFHWPCHTI